MTVLPTVNATLNAASCVLLCLAFVFIKTGRWRAHGYAMVSATLVSVAFLICYLSYHYMYGEAAPRATRMRRIGWAIYLPSDSVPASAAGDGNAADDLPDASPGVSA